MLFLKTKILVLDSGERVPLIIDSDTAVPHLELNSYLFYVRKPGLSFKSLKKESEALCLIFNSSDYLFKNDGPEGIFLNLTGSRIYEIWTKLRKSSKNEEVADSTHMFRWDVFYNFIKHLTSDVIYQTSFKDQNFKNLEIKQKILLNGIENLRYKTKSSRLSGLDKKIVQEIIRISRVNSINNPWIERDRLRNQVIVDLLLRLGLRSGELLKISLDDLHFNSSHPYIEVTRKINDIEDPRKDEPRVKTFGRLLEIDDGLLNDIIKLQRSRKAIPGSRKTKFLLISNTDGKPISYDRLHAILECIQLPKYKDIKVTPHSLRRSWNDLFREYADESGLDQEIISQLQNYLQGRVLDSKEAAKYSAKYIEKSARIAHINFQKSLLGDE